MTLDPILVTPLRQIATPGGPVFHGIRTSDPGYSGFGEAYFSRIDVGAVKGWKRHSRMTLNLIVPNGLIQISATDGNDRAVRNYLLGPNPSQCYLRLTVPPGWWIAFGGLAEASMMLNVANIVHDPAEAENVPIDRFAWEWYTS